MAESIATPTQNDPRRMFAMQVAAAFAHFVAGDPAKALAMAEDALRIQPNFLVGLCVVAASAGLCGRLRH